jgi:processive 1,2-diacylglycerol beta-glucosyltransferase
MYISENSGHHSASLAIEAGLKHFEPNLATLNIDGFNHTNPVLGRVITTTYMGVIKTNPEVWEYLYDNPKVVRRTMGLRLLLHRFNDRKLKALLKGFMPDAVVCTQAFPCGMVADYKKTYKTDIPLVGVLTDFMPHSYWIFDTVDTYVVASEPTKHRLVRFGVPQEKIKVLGIPISPRFLIRHDKGLIRRKFNLERSIPVVLLMGGSQGLGPMKDLVSCLDALDIPLQVIVLTGTNRRLKAALERKRRRLRVRVIVLEYVEDVDEIMEVSTVIVTKSGGLTAAEAMSKGLPMIIVDPIPGQEAKNAEFLVGRGVALKARDEEDAALLVKKLLKDSHRLDQMRRAARSCARPDAALDIAKVILQLMDTSKTTRQYGVRQRT